jgi:hypothetical protein
VSCRSKSILVANFLSFLLQWLGCLSLQRRVLSKMGGLAKKNSEILQKGLAVSMFCRNFAKTNSKRYSKRRNTP